MRAEDVFSPTCKLCKNRLKTEYEYFKTWKLSVMQQSNREKANFRLKSIAR